MPDLDTRPEDQAQDNRYNPSDDDYRQKFNGHSNKKGNADNLGDAEQAAAQPANGGASGENPGSSEQQAGADNPNGYYQPRDNTKKESPREPWRKRILNSTRKKIVAGVTAGVLTAGGIFGFGAAPGITIVNLKEVMTHSAGAKVETLLNARSNEIWIKKMNASDKTPRITGLCGNKIQVACRYQNMSDKAITKLTERAKKVNINMSIESSEDKVLGKRKIQTITMDGKKMTAAEFASALRKGDEKVVKSVQNLMKPRYAAWAGASVQKLFLKLRISKSMGITGETSKEKAKEKLKANQAGVSDADLSAREKINPEDDAAEKARKEKANALLDKLGGANSEDLGGRMSTSVLDNLAKTGENTVKRAAGSIAKTVSILGTVDSACTILNLIAATGYMAKALGSIQLVRFAMTVGSSADAIKLGSAAGAAMGSDTSGGGVTPEGIQAIGELLTTTTADDKRTAFDSYGYQYAAYGLLGDSNDTAEFRVGGGIPGNMVGFVNQVQETLGNGAVCDFVQNGWVRAGSFIIGIAAAIFSGGTIPLANVSLQVGLGAGLSVIQAFALPLIADMIKGEYVNDSTVGNSAGNALTAGFEELFAQNGNAIGAYPLTVDQAVAFDNTNQKTYLASRDADTVAETGQFDAGNPASFLGNIVKRSASIIYSPSFADASTKLLSFIAMPLSPSTYAADPRDKYTVCPDDEYKELGIATTPMCVPVMGQTSGDMDRDPDETLLYMYDNGYIDNNGAPLGDYQRFVTECVENTNPYGRKTEDTGVDVIKPEQCIPSKSNYPAQFWAYSTDAAVYEKMQCLVEEEESSCGVNANSSISGAGTCENIPNTLDYGDKDGYDDGKKVTIHTCGLSDWPSNFENSAGDKVVEVNATIAKQASEMAAALKADATAKGYDYTASIGFRTYEQQKCIYDYYISGNKGCSVFNSRPPDAARPGYSNHQMGYSIDLESGYSCSSRTYGANAKANAWLDANMKTYGFSRDVGCGDWGHFTNKGSVGTL